MRCSSAAEKISADRIFLCFGVNPSLRFINSSIVDSGVVDPDGFSKIPINYVVPVKKKILIIRFRNLIGAASNIPRTCGTKLPEHICLHRN